MRQDMNQVVFGSRRAGHIPLKPGRTPRDLELLASREGMRRPYIACYGLRSKETRLNYAPLHRYLDSQIGKPWDKVYADICRIFDARKPENRHVLDHLQWRIQTTGLVVKDGQVLELSPYSGWTPVSGWYVHPETRLLQKASEANWNAVYRERKAREQAEAQANVRVVSKTHRLVKHEGIWYMVEYAPVQPPKTYLATEYVWDASQKGRVPTKVKRIDDTTYCVDVLTGRIFTLEYIERYPNETVYAKKKRQASHQEMRRHGVI